MKTTVVMPVYNAQATVLRAVESLCAQRIDGMEIVVVDDGSTDGTLDLLRRLQGIQLLKRPHRGIVATLNDGLEAAQGEYIARMDADDDAHPDRIKKQCSYLDRHPEIGLVGCRVGFGGDRTHQAGYAAYVDWINGLIDPDTIAVSRFIESPFAHPSVMFRRELVSKYGGYRDGPFPEDYELWLRWMDAGVQVAKIDEELLTWNDPPDRLSRTDPRYQVDAFYGTKSRYLMRWLEQHNPHHPDIIIWGAGRVTRKRVKILQQHGVHITQYIDIKQRVLNDGIPVISPECIPSPENGFILSMVANRGARELIRTHLDARGYIEGVNFIFAA